jgi:hypothetical protein
MKKYERLLWLFVLILIGFLYLNERQEVESIESWVIQQNEQLRLLDSLLINSEPDSSINLLASRSSDWLFAFEIQLLNDLGLSDPINDLKSDLMSNPSLIPYEGVLGGTIRVYTKDHIRLLPGRYVYAIFEDGHIQGAMILQYEVKDGSIRWEIIESRLF